LRYHLSLGKRPVSRGINDHPFDTANGVLEINLELIRQRLRYNPHKAARISVNHAIQRFSAALFPPVVHVRNESLAELILKPEGGWRARASTGRARASVSWAAARSWHCRRIDDTP
jgi:hypothetical protein